MKIKGIKGPSHLSASSLKEGKREFYAGIGLALIMTFLGLLGTVTFFQSAIEEFKYAYYLSGLVRIALALPAAWLTYVGGSYSFIFIRFLATSKNRNYNQSEQDNPITRP